MFEDDYEDEQDEQDLSAYIEMGVIELEGMDENGEAIFSINESAKTLAPELWQSHIDYVDKSLIELYQAGLVKVEYNEDLEATFLLSPEGHALAKEKGLIEMDINRNIPND
jgi:hypothetical protein